MNSDRPQTEQKYTAPALEKGLDIIEFLATADGPQTVAEISNGLGRSRGELFRMLSVLQQRGIISKSASGDAYVVTDRLFSLRLKRSLATQITIIALPEMEKFTLQTGLNCHLATRFNQETVVILRVEHPENLNISVPVGHRRKVWDSPSGLCILAFSSEQVLNAALSSWSADDVEKRAFERHLDQVRTAGHAMISPGVALGVTGISAPIMNKTDGTCCFALTTTVIEHAAAPNPENVATAIKNAAAAISRRNDL